MSRSPLENPPPAAAEELILPADEFWEEHKVKIIGAVVAVLLLAIGGIVVAAWQREQSAAARAAFAEASTVEDWRSLMERYRGTPIGQNSGLLLAAALREAGEIEASSQVYQELLELRGPFALQSAAALGLAQNDILQNTRPTASTLAALQAVATRFPDSYAAPYALYTEGDLLLRQGDTEAAQQVFRNLLTDYPNSVPGQMASMQLQRLAEESVQNIVQSAIAGEEPAATGAETVGEDPVATDPAAEESAKPGDNAASDAPPPGAAAETPAP
jgi:predicted negative regulator of RcsB-dependent stress response